MIVVEYDPKKGVSMPDAEIENFVDTVILDHIKKGDEYLIVSNEMVISMFRVKIAEGSLQTENIIFEFEGQQLRATKAGRMEHWPKGFCDNFDFMLDRLLKI